MKRIFLAAALAALASFAVASAVLAGWYWNAKFDVEGATTRVVWYTDGASDQSRADIELDVPAAAKASLVSQMTDRETVHIVSDNGLACEAGRIKVRAKVQVDPDGSNAGRRAYIELHVNGSVLASRSGLLGRTIEVEGALPVTSPSCAK